METKSKTLGAVIVTRVSTGEQAKHGTSLESQLDSCRAKAAAMGLAIIAEYEDAGVSGNLLTTREGMQHAIIDIQEGRANTLICANISRFSRNVEHQQALVKNIRAAGGRLVFSEAEFEENATGDFNFVIQGGYAAFERQIIRERTMRGKRKRAEEGQQPQRSRPPYGYHIITNAEVECGLKSASERGHYVIVEERADVVRRIFDLYVNGLSSLPQIAKTFNREGIPTPGRGRTWEHATIRVILTNPAYKGEPVSGRQKCHVDESRLGQLHKWTGRPITRPEVRELVAEEDQLKLASPPIVTAEVWEAAQRRLEKNRTFQRGNPNRVQMLTGITICPNCRERAVFKSQNANGKRYRYLTCGQQRRAAALTGNKPCSGDLYPVSFMEEATAKVIEVAYQDPKAIAAAPVVYLGNEASLPHDATELRQELTKLDNALEELKAENMLCVRAQIAGMKDGAPGDAYKEIFADIAARRKDIENRRGVVSLALTSSSGERKKTGQQRVSKAVQQALEEAWRVLSSPDVPGHTKRDILMPLVDKVILHKDGVEVIFAPGLFEEGEGRSRELNCYTTCIGIRTQR